MSIAALNTAIYSKLGGTATSAGTAVFFEAAPDNQPLPYIIWDYVADQYDNQTPVDTVNAVVFVRAYASTRAAAGTIDGQIKALLHKATLSVTGFTNFQTRRENAYSQEETDKSGRMTYMAGAEYRVRLSE